VVEFHIWYIIVFVIRGILVDVIAPVRMWTSMLKYLIDGLPIDYATIGSWGNMYP
jgi:hypothetical protein